jgi:hypothetical protein
MHPSDDMEFLRLNTPQEEPPAARPQHLKFCRDLMIERDWSEMAKGMPNSWWKLFLAIKAGENTYNGKPILRSDVNKIVAELKKCATRRKSHDRDRRDHNIAQDMIEKKDVVLANKPPLAPPGQFAAPRTPVELADGMYRNPDKGTIYKLYHTVHGANVQVAKELIVVDPGERATPLSYSEGKTTTPDEKWVRKPTVRFDYRGRKPLYSLTPEMRLSIEEAKEFGALYGTCCICGRMLTNELSIHLGIGPVCGSREFGGDFEFMVDDAKQYIDGEVISVNYEDEIAKIDAQMKELGG